MVINRAAILPFPGDPFLFTYWLHFFDTVWGGEIETLYVTLNSSIEKSVVDYIRGLCDKRPQIVFTYIPRQIEHGDVIDKTLDIVKEDYVMLVEDDGFIFKPGRVDHFFKALELGDYDIVGSKRGSCSMEILTRAQQLYGLTYEGEGDQGPNFWPCYFFTKTGTLRQTDRKFAARAWQRGEVIESLDNYTVQGEIAVSDTFVNTSLQLQAKYPQNRILYIPQYHGSPDDLDHYEAGKYLFDGLAPWTHIGSLSSGVGGVLMDEVGRSLARRTVELPKGLSVLNPTWCTTDQERNEWSRRVQWWLTFIEYFLESPESKEQSRDMAEFSNLYMKAVNRVISQYGLNLKNIRRRQAAYKTLGL